MITNKPKNAQVVTYSELDTFRQCPLKHQWSYVDKYRKDPGVGSALHRGTLWHQVMESHYLLVQEVDPEVVARRGWSVVRQALKQFALQHFLTDEAGNQNEDQQLVEWMYDGYLERYGLDLDWEPLAVEDAGEVRFRDENGRATRFFLRFKIDMVVRQRSTGTLWLVDHKTTSMFAKESEIELDEQFRLYTWALRQMGVPIHGVIRSDSRTRRNKGPMELDQRFRRVSTFVTEVEAHNVAQDALRAAKAAYQGNRQVYASPAPDRCVWRCDYQQVHIAQRKGLGSSEVLMKDFGFRRSEIKHREYAPDPVASAIRSGDLSLGL